MHQLSNHPVLNQALNKLFEHSDAVRNGEDSQEAAKRIFTASKEPIYNSVCCQARIINEALNTRCSKCGEYANIIEDRPLAF